jgi:hypothetical protein
VLVVVEDGDLERLTQACLDLEAAGRGDVLEVDPTEPRGDGGDGCDDLVGVGRRQANGPRVDPAELLEEDRFLPSMTGSAGSGPMSPSPRTAVPSVTTATAFCLTVRFQTFSGSSAIARQMRATPGV